MGKTDRPIPASYCEVGTISLEHLFTSSSVFVIEIIFDK